jgi:hypothetical protein
VEEKEPSRCAEEEEIQIAPWILQAGRGLVVWHGFLVSTTPVCHVHAKRSGLAVRPSREAGSQGEQRRARRHRDN